MVAGDGTVGKRLGDAGRKMTGDWSIKGRGDGTVKMEGEGTVKMEGEGRRRPGELPVCVSPPPVPARCVMLVLTGGVVPTLVWMLTLLAVLVASDVLMLMLPTWVVAVLVMPPTPALGLLLTPGGPGGPEGPEGPDGPGGPGGPGGAGGGMGLTTVGEGITIGGSVEGDGGNGPNVMGEGNAPVVGNVPWSTSVPVVDGGDDHRQA